MNVPEIKELTAYGVFLAAIFMGGKLVVPWLLKQVETSNAFVREIIDDQKDWSKEMLTVNRAIADEIRSLRRDTSEGFGRVQEGQTKVIVEIKREIEKLEK